MEIGKFLKQRDIIYTLCAAALSTQIIAIADILTTSVIVPIINNSGTTEVEPMEKFIVDLKGIRFEIGKILICIIRLFVVIIMLYVIYHVVY